MRFHDRTDAGRQLARALATSLEIDVVLRSPIVLALPRGGVPVAVEVAASLNAPLDVHVVRKVGAPGHPEYGIGAVAEGGTVVLDREAVSTLGLSDQAFAGLVEVETRELERRVQRYRGARPLPELKGRDVVVVDDGLATGVTAEAALRSIEAQEPRRLVLAVPVCALETADRLRSIADDVVYVDAPSPFLAVGRFYDRFDQTSDEEVIDLLAEADERVLSASQRP